MTTSTKIPVIVVTGFLGAGKTTFLNWLIHTHRHLKLALVENEFGTTSIDRDLIVGMRSENIYDLSNGCICCSISNEFSMTLLDLADQAGKIDYLLIETTGVADLANVIRPFFTEKDLIGRFSYQGSICLVDALNYNEQLKGNEQQMQIILSDLLLINKSAGLDETRLAELERLLLAYNSSAKLQRTEFGQAHDFKLESFTEEVHGTIEKKLTRPVIFRLIESKKYTTFTHQFKGNINLARFQHWFYYFAAISQREIYRIKGVLFPENSADKMIVQSVGGTVSYTPGSMITPEEEKINTLVFIGKAIDPERIVWELDEYLREESYEL
ncbi:MAG: CobW family GTP-binding protein [Mangrovibacterium sp.]